MKITDTKKLEAEERRQKRVMIVLFSLCFLGLFYVVYDYAQIIDRSSFPEDLSEMDHVIQEWQQDGFVESLDVAAKRLVVNERMWEGKRREEKVGIITQLARYCAERTERVGWDLQVVGNSTSAVLGEMGRTGLRVH